MKYGVMTNVGSSVFLGSSHARDVREIFTGSTTNANARSVFGSYLVLYSRNYIAFGNILDFFLPTTFKR